MDLNVWISALSVFFSWIFCTALTAPAADPPAAEHPAAVSAQRHVRNKRCSCATFLDKECVYFCHLDIIWVNTPERVVSYGLGNAPRTRRALADPIGARGPRCQCVRENDTSCTSFCLRRETAADAVMKPAENGSGAAERGIDRTKASSRKRASPLALRAVLRTRLLLEKWRARRRHRSRVPQDEGALF